MPRPARIVQWRYRRQRKSRTGGRVFRRNLGILSLALLFGLILLLMGGMLAVVIAYASLTGETADFDQVISAWERERATVTNSRIFAWSDAEQTVPVQIYEITDPLGKERRWVRLEQLPQSLIDATVAFEDPTFWSAQDLNNTDLIRLVLEAALQDGLENRNLSLTRSVVKLNLLSENGHPAGNGSGFSSLGDSIKEAFLSHRASNSYTRGQILEWYLNTAYYGNLAFGIEAAARVYFDKPVADLTLAEAAMLAAIPREPAMNPLDRAQEAKERQEQVLEAMVETGALSDDILDAAVFAPVLVAPGLEKRFDVIAPHFALYVRRELESRFGPELLLYGGLRVYTSLDLEAQQQAECVAQAQVNRLSGHIGPDLPADERESCAALAYLQPLPTSEVGLDRNASNAAVLALDAESAEIRAMVGSLSFWDEDIDGSFNFAADGRRQPGTAIRPFIYLAALSQGYTASTMVLDVETDFSEARSGEPFLPRNDDQQFHGPMRLREALGNGYNVPAVEVMSWVGVDKVLRTSHSLGITGLDKPSQEYDLTLALGGGEVSPIDMAYAYNVINNMGVMLGQPREIASAEAQQRTLDPVAILRVEDQTGDAIYEYEQPERREILTPQLAYLMNDMLSDRSARCAEFGCPNVMELPDGRPAAVVTGGSDDSRDAWTIGYTPQLVVAVWVGNNDNRPMEGLSGVEAAAPIWQAFMSWAMQDEPAAVWTQPPGLVEIAVCNISGLLTTPYCAAVSELFVAGTQPTLPDNMYQEFAVNRETGRLATLFTPPELVERRIYRLYPEQAAEWARENGIEEPPEEYDTLGIATQVSPDAIITQPSAFAAVAGLVSVIGTAAGEEFEAYRLAFFQGLEPTDLAVIVDNVNEVKEDELLGEWDATNLDGLYTLLLTVFRTDGTFTESALPLTIDNTPPTVRLTSPFPGQNFSAGTLRIPVRVEAEDNIAVRLVRFHLDAAEDAFFTSNEAPFATEWTVRDDGCHTISAVAVDAAGNEGRSLAIPFCVASEDSG